MLLDPYTGQGGVSRDNVVWNGVEEVFGKLEHLICFKVCPYYKCYDSASKRTFATSRPSHSLLFENIQVDGWWSEPWSGYNIERNASVGRRVRK